MRRQNSKILREVLTSAAVLGVFRCAYAAPADTEPETWSHLTTHSVVMTLLASTVLLLFGILFRLRQLRIQLERKSKALYKSEQHIRLMGDNLPNVTIFQLTYTNEDSFRFNYISKGYERALGFDRDSVIANADIAYDHVYEEDLPILQQTFIQSRDALEPADLEFRVLDVSGNLKWLYVSAVPHFDHDTLIWDGFMQDISDAKNIEDALIEENRNFQNLFDTIDDLLLVCDTNGKLLHANPSVEQRLGYSRDELASMSIFELYSEDGRTEIYQAIAHLQKEQTSSCSQPLRTRNGTGLSVDMNMFQGYWKNKKALFGVARDVASRQRAETALRESQQMLQLIMDTIPMSVFWKDKDSVYLGCNKTFIHECGLNSIDDVVGKTPFDLFTPLVAPEVIEHDQTVISTNQPIFNLTQSRTQGDGSVGSFEISKIPLHDDDGRAVGVLDVWRDVTEENLAEERLKRTLEDMERFNQLMRGRERRTLELKAEINNLMQELGRSEKYQTTTENLRAL